MFMDYQNFAESFRWKFVDNRFVALKCKTIQFFVISLWEHKFVGKVDLRTNTDSPGTIKIPQYYIFQ